MKLQIIYNCGVTQIFNVIKQVEFTDVIKPLRIRQNEIESLNKKQRKKHIEELNTITCKLKSYGDNWITDESPIYKSLETQKLILPEYQGGTTNVNTKLI